MELFIFNLLLHRIDVVKILYYIIVYGKFPHLLHNNTMTTDEIIVTSIESKTQEQIRDYY